MGRDRHVFPLSADIVCSPGFLDALRDAIHAWSIGLYDEASGGFRQNADIGVNIMSSTDMVWMRYATNDPDPGAPDRAKLIAYLEAAQEPDTGMVRHDPGPAGQNHCDAHAFWQTVRALSILGGKLRHFPHHLASLVTPEGLAAWFDSIDWDSRDHSNHHEVLGIVPLLASLDDPEWTDVFYAKITEQQETDTGGWPRGETNISRTYAYTVIHLATGRVAPLPDRTTDTMLALQQPDAMWDGPPPAFHTMDAAYVLLRLPPLVGHRETDARAALRRLADALPESFIRNQRRYMDNPHKMLAVTQTFQLLQEAFPNDFPSIPPYRFDWDKPEVYACDVIREGRPET